MGWSFRYFTSFENVRLYETTPWLLGSSISFFFAIQGEMKASLSVTFIYFFAYMAAHIMGLCTGISMGISSGIYLSIYPTTAGQGCEILPK